MQTPIFQSQQVLARAVAAHQAGNIAEAEFLYKLVLQADKKQFDALHMLGVIEAQRGNFSGGLERLKEALRIKPNSPDALINLGRMQSELGDDKGALATYEKAVALDPRSALAHSNMSNVLRDLGRFEAALEHCDAALALAPQYADAWSNRGGVLFELDRVGDALTSYDRALALDPRHAGAYFGRGNICARRMQHDEALAAFDKAIAVRPDEADYHLARGNLLQQLTRYEAALAAYDRAIALDPNLAPAWYGRGSVLNWMGRREEAYTAFAKAFALEPNLPYVEGERLLAKLRLCAWDNLEAEYAHMADGIRKGALRSTPFTMIVASPSAADQQKCAELHVAHLYSVSPRPLWRGERYRHDRIRVAYLASEFHGHVVAYVLAGVFEAHDRSRFETTAVSFGPDIQDEMRSRLRGSFDRFLEVSEQSDDQIARTLRDLEIDIVIDLNGFTGFSRTAVLAQRVAPIQVSYLGYPGTMAAPFIDYIIADRTVIPPEHAAFYSEKVVWMPDTYQAYDNNMRVAPLAPTRDQLELPNDAFVFCSFNNPYKITPSVFGVWMRLLKEVSGSVLWLFRENDAVLRNLREAAAREGVAPERLIFAPLVPLPEHLARHNHADLALDTLPYNGHATTSHALWAGVPVVTCLGSTFAGRVSASVVRAVGVPQLVTESMEDYYALALRIASDQDFCSSLKAELARNRETFPLFDTKRFARNIEAAYVAMWQRYQNGELPQNIAVAAE